MIQNRRIEMAGAVVVCCCATLWAANAKAEALVFTIDSSQSYVSLNIPNFSLSNTSGNITGQNRTNGAPISAAWSSSTNTGNTAFVSGTIATTVGGSFTGQTLSAIQFISGANNLVALNSGNYRPNLAAYNSISSIFNNNSSAPANYGGTVHSSLGNAALVSFNNTRYDIGSGNLPASNTVGSGTFTSDALLNPLNTGVLESVFSGQGLSIFLTGQLVPNGAGLITATPGPDTITSYTYTYTSPTNLQITIGMSTPFSIILGNQFLNGTESGRYVANATVPEPPAVALTLLGIMSLVVILRHHRWLSRRAQS